MPSWAIDQLKFLTGTIFDSPDVLVAALLTFVEDTWHYDPWYITAGLAALNWLIVRSLISLLSMSVIALLCLLEKTKQKEII
jgi:hypothetical protein